MDAEQTQKDALSFEKLWDEELGEIQSSREKRQRDEPVPTTEGEPRERACEANLVGLAFSGGGIRSATFNLGILQALAQLRLLRRFDYLSTVSGGGYIGSWLAAWVHRDGIRQVEEGLAPQPVHGSSATEHEAVRFLRTYSNYLTPRLGLFSPDTWTMVSVYLRNLVLNQGVLVLVLAALLMAPRCLVHCSALLGRHPAWAIGAAVLLVLLALINVVLNLLVFRDRQRRAAPKTSHQQQQDQAQGYPRYTRPAHVLGLIVVPLVIAAWLLSCALWSLMGWPDQSHLLPGFLMRTGGAAAAPWHVATWGTPAVLLGCWLAGVLMVGALGRLIPDEVREWTSRLGATLLICGLAWAGLFALSVYGALALLRLDEAWAGLTRLGLGPAWIATTIGGVLAGRSSSTGKQGASRPLELLARVAPYVFILGLLCLVSLLIHRAYLLLAVPASYWRYWDQLDFTVRSPQGPTVMLWTVLSTAALVGLACLASWRVDINQFSMHLFYRNRLVRCYLGASHPKSRRFHPFTGFYRKDEVPLKDLAPKAGHSGPYPILNCALNLTHGEELAWQKRKATSFTFTPKFCGFDPGRRAGTPGEGEQASDPEPGTYRRTEDYAGGAKGVTLGTAMAISGAAASPNMGFHTSAPVAFLMTVFNVRLGWWLGNPRHPESWERPGPGLGLRYLLGELFGMTGDRSPYVYLSDGGHFENLGIYELVRRRCRFIVACDGSEDRQFTFEGLGNAIEKCRTDFQVHIQIDPEQLRPAEGSRLSRWHCAVGRIRYDLTDPGAPAGTLVYLKASLTGGEPADVKRYAAENQAFPHQPTSDQWFDESQFESYRALGHHIGRVVFDPALAAGELEELPTEDLFLALREHWHRPSAAVQASFTRHAAALDRIMQSLRTSPGLEFLDEQIYPEWRRLMSDATRTPRPHLWLPPSHAERRAGFYLAQQMIQLMESVYLDLNLEQESDHPDNRGWMNLFKHWSWSGMFRVTWAISAATYGARFQGFCAQRLGLDVRADVQVGEPCNLEEAAAGDTFNFLEKDLLADFVELNRSTLMPDRVYPLQIRIEDQIDRGRNVFFFTFGLALVGRSTQPGDLNDDAILYFRIQDHLRSMGLSRPALTKLITEKKITRALPGTMARKGAEAVGDDEVKRFKQLFDSVKCSR